MNVGTGTGVLAGAASGAPTGYVPVGAADAAGAGKPEVNGVTAGGGAVVLRFRVAIPGSRPYGKKIALLTYHKQNINTNQAVAQEVFWLKAHLAMNERIGSMLRNKKKLVPCALSSIST